MWRKLGAQSAQGKQFIGARFVANGVFVHKRYWSTLDLEQNDRSKAFFTRAFNRQASNNKPKEAGFKQVVQMLTTPIQFESCWFQYRSIIQSSHFHDGENATFQREGLTWKWPTQAAPYGLHECILVVVGLPPWLDSKNLKKKRLESLEKAFKQDRHPFDKTFKRDKHPFEKPLKHGLVLNIFAGCAIAELWFRSTAACLSKS